MTGIVRTPELRGISRSLSFSRKKFAMPLPICGHCGRNGNHPTGWRLNRIELWSAWHGRNLLPPLPRRKRQDRQNRKKTARNPSKMEPLVGFEPTTCSLRIPERPAWMLGFSGKVAKLPPCCHYASTPPPPAKFSKAFTDEVMLAMDSHFVYWRRGYMRITPAFSLLYTRQDLPQPWMSEGHAAHRTNHSAKRLPILRWSSTGSI